MKEKEKSKRTKEDGSSGEIKKDKVNVLRRKMF